MDFRNLEEIGTAIQARHIAVPIAKAYSVTPSADEHVVLTELRERSYDFAPVIQGDRVVGLFCGQGQDAPDAPARPKIRPLQEDLLVTDSTPVAELFRCMGQEPFLFVVSQRRISGFVATTDLGGPPVRTHFYLLFAAAEMAMASLVRRDYPDQSVAVRLLNDKRQAYHAALIEQLRGKDDVLDDVAALSFGELLQICKNNQGLCDWLAANGHSFKSTERGLAHFRNDVMHPVRQFTDGTPQKINQLTTHDLHLRHLIRGTNQVLGLDPMFDSASGG